MTHERLAAAATTSTATVDKARLAALVPVIRTRLRIASDVTDDVLLRGLAEIAALRTGTDRWRAAFNSEVGRWLAARGTDLNTALNIILGIVPLPHR